MFIHAIIRLCKNQKLKSKVIFILQALVVMNNDMKCEKHYNSKHIKLNNTVNTNDQLQAGTIRSYKFNALL